MLVLAAGLLALSAPASLAQDRVGRSGAATVNPRAFPSLTTIYVMSGVRDTGSAADTGTATIFHCSNWTASTQQVRFFVRTPNGAVVANKTYLFSAAGTVSLATHGTLVYGEDDYLAPGTVIKQGTAMIMATAPQVVCSAQVIDAAAAAPVGVDLHLVRFNPWPGSQE